MKSIEQVAQYATARRGKDRQVTHKARDKPQQPTSEYLARNKTRRAGMAYQKIPIIEQMRDDGRLTEQEYERLSYYADQAELADKSPVKSNLDRSVGGQGDGPGSAIISAILETGRIERDLGQLQPIARAIAVDGLTLSQWCIVHHGGRERYGKRGKFICMVPVNEKKVMKMALLELRMAAHRIVK